MRSLLTLCALGAALATPAFGDTDDFESYAPGVFPAPFWLDMGLVNPDPPNPPDPSAVVVETTDAFGAPTRALAFVEALAESQGIYRGVLSQPTFHVSADVRVDRFADHPNFEPSDWAVEIGAGQYVEGVDFCCTPQIGVYASAFTQGWRLYGVGDTSGSSDLDLGLPVELGRWYTIEVDIDVVSGIAGSRISDTLTGEVLVDRVDAVEGWVPEDGPFDTVLACDGELSEANTVSNLAVVDNLTYETGEGCIADCNGDGELNILDFVCFQQVFLAGCP